MIKTKKNYLIEVLSQKIILILMACLVLFLLGLYFYQVQDLMKNGYLFSNYQKRLSQAQSQNLSFNQQAVEIVSLGKVEERAIALNFVKNDNIKYIPLSNDYLVRVGR